MQALGLIETKGLVAAIVAVDAMLKAADVNILEKTYVGGGLVSIAVTGDVAAAKVAVEAGAAAVKLINNTLLISQHVIPRPHEYLDKIIVSSVPAESEDILVTASEEAELKEEVENIVEVPVEVKETVTIEDLGVKETDNRESMPKETTALLKEGLSKKHNKEAVDKIVFECGPEKAIEILSKYKVVELRNLARKYENFGIRGREISRASKKLLIAEFGKYYEHS